jgi:proline utilization trans-activator
MERGATPVANSAIPSTPGLQARQLRGSVDAAATVVAADEEEEEEDVVTADVANPLLEQRIDTSLTAASGKTTSRPVFIGGASCAAFATRLQAHVSGESSPSNGRPPCLIRVFKHPRLQRALVDNVGIKNVELPPRAYAMMLVQIVLRFVGNDYHLVRRKDFFRRLERLYDEHALGKGGADAIFLCRAFVVFALGELYLKRTSVNEGGARVVPGTAFFLQATALFRELYEEPDVEYIETLSLMVSCHDFLFQ